MFFNGIKGQRVRAYTLTRPFIGEIKDTSDEAIIIGVVEGGPETGFYTVDVKLRVSAIVAYNLWTEEGASV